MVNYLGWAATIVFVLSYFCRRGDVLRRIQMIGALMWTIYGAFMHAAPVIVANLLVFCAAAWTGAHSSTCPSPKYTPASGIRITAPSRSLSTARKLHKLTIWDSS